MTWRLEAPGLRAVGILVVLSLAASPSYSAQDSGDSNSPTHIQVAFGAEEIWQPSQAALARLFACEPPSSTCVDPVMAGDGASADAVAFYHLTGWFLSSISSDTPIQVATILDPWRANENTQYALVGGIPAVVYLEQEAPTNEAEASAAFKAIKAAHPNALFWPESPAQDRIDMSPRGGPRFVFDYRVLDGCHTCAVLGTIPIAFDFMADGTYMSARVLS